MKTRRALSRRRSGPVRVSRAAPALAKPRKPKDADWTETFDVIVIGSGLAAFVAACRLLRAEPSAWPCSKKWA